MSSFFGRKALGQEPLESIVRKYLGRYPNMTTTDLMGRAACGRRAADRALTKMMNEGELTRVARATYAMANKEAAE